MSDRLYYLGQPYWSEEEAVRAQRAEAGAAAAAHLLSHGVLCYSPIATGIAVKRYLSAHQGHDFWMSVDLPLLTRCDALLILPLDGWKESKGLAEEVGTARALGKPVLWLEGFVPSVGKLWAPSGSPSINSTQDHVWLTH